MKIAKKTKSVIVLLAALCSNFSIGAVRAESLYSESSFRPLTADNKAFRIGDAVTVQVLETSSASTNADTTTRRKNGVNADFSLTRNPNITAGVNVGGDFDGGGRTQRASKLLTQLTVSVIAIQPNGDLQLAGEQILYVNDEEQRVKLEGRARPQDISDGNIILSTRLADARITYVGDGDLSERQRRGWWRRFVDWLGF
ncbi:flagellar basal body L-ring protein FlgH [Herbaspirillum sp. WGmk3]|uniref:flagellar basal body L-ring protein FlgH n=1 Tax=Herbaspirillum sp. WGmk3 TaxID=2919925 RepID=UPI00209021CB|nr:flagellar basal body L-ring protein FlgH [Herbaspirillum sp. WGmk3]MCO4855938.1 flagellar basal body L-ring protein FlgH [Herbaspirillum sp. WGmk3]